MGQSLSEELITGALPHRTEDIVAFWITTFWRETVRHKAQSISLLPYVLNKSRRKLKNNQLTEVDE
jgi:hypothetical protein